MAKRGSDADNRKFFDEFENVCVSRFRATGVIDPSKSYAVIPVGDKTKVLSTAHVRFSNGGGWSYFRCPKCGNRAKKLWLVNGAPRCRICLEKLGVRYRSAYAFGQTERLRMRDRRVDKLQAMLEGGPLRLFQTVTPIDISMTYEEVRKGARRRPAYAPAYVGRLPFLLRSLIALGPPGRCERHGRP
jgi:hypothetical protein